MSYDAKIHMQLPERVEVPCSYGRLTRMLASRVRISSYDPRHGFPVHVTVYGRGIRRDGTLSRLEASARVQLPPKPFGEVSLQDLGDANQQAILTAVGRVERAARILSGDEDGGES